MMNNGDDDDAQGGRVSSPRPWPGVLLRFLFVASSPPLSSSSSSSLVRNRFRFIGMTCIYWFFVIINNKNVPFHETAALCLNVLRFLLRFPYYLNIFSAR